MLYAPSLILDQTNGYFTPDGKITITPGDAVLFETREEARALLVRHGEDPDFIEEVEDEAEFRARPDTW